LSCGRQQPVPINTERLPPLPDTGPAPDAGPARTESRRGGRAAGSAIQVWGEPWKSGWENSALTLVEDPFPARIDAATRRRRMAPSLTPSGSFSRRTARGDLQIAEELGNVG